VPKPSHQWDTRTKQHRSLRIGGKEKGTHHQGLRHSGTTREMRQGGEVEGEAVPRCHRRALCLELLGVSKLSNKAAWL